MDYYTSAEGVKISKKRAIQEVKAHGASLEEFFTDLGELEEYDAQAVLRWLGY